MLRKGNADHISYTMKLLKVLLLKALESLRKRGDIVESALEEEADSAEDIQDPYEIGSFEAFRFLEVYILMHMFKQGDWYDISVSYHSEHLISMKFRNVLISFVFISLCSLSRNTLGCYRPTLLRFYVG